LVLGKWHSENGVSEKWSFGKLKFGKLNFGKLNFEKLGFGKMDIRKIRIRKNGIWKIDFGILGGYPIGLISRCKYTLRLPSCKNV